MQSNTLPTILQSNSIPGIGFQASIPEIKFNLYTFISSLARIFQFPLKCIVLNQKQDGLKCRYGTSSPQDEVGMKAVELPVPVGLCDLSPPRLLWVSGDWFLFSLEPPSSEHERLVQLVQVAQTKVMNCSRMTLKKIY